jgi:hypothetical protein
MKLKNYLKYSGMWMGFVLNPYHWEFKIQRIKPDDMNPKNHGFMIACGPVWVRGVIDDGTW